MNEKNPIFLENYDVFQELTQWKEALPEEKKPSWELRSFNKTFFACSLYWTITTPDGNRQLASLQGVEATPQIAVWLALHEFSKNGY